MSTDFLDNLPLSPDERSRLRRLGAADAYALLGMIDGSYPAFKNYMGPLAAERLSKLLHEKFAPAGGAVEAIEDQPRRFGARLDPHVSPPLPQIDLAHRDRLFARLQSLRADKGAQDVHRQEIEALTRQIAELYNVRS